MIEAIKDTWPMALIPAAIWLWVWIEERAEWKRNWFIRRAEATCKCREALARLGY